MKSFLAIFITVIVLGFLYSHFSFSKVSPELSITSTSKYSSLKTRAVAASCALAPDKEEYATCNYTCPNGTTILGISQCGGACTPNNLGGTLSYYDHKTFRTVTVPPSSCSSSSCTNGAINYPACNICPGAATANIFNTQCVGTCDSRNTCTLKNVCGQSITGYMCNGKCTPPPEITNINNSCITTFTTNTDSVNPNGFVDFSWKIADLNPNVTSKCGFVDLTTPTPRPIPGLQNLDPSVDRARISNIQTTTRFCLVCQFINLLTNNEVGNAVVHQWIRVIRIGEN